VGKLLVSFCLGITAVGLGVATIYLPYLSPDAKDRAERVRKGEDVKAAGLRKRNDSGGGSDDVDNKSGSKNMWKKIPPKHDK
jgi:hypothetical protein